MKTKSFDRGPKTNYLVSGEPMQGPFIILTCECGYSTWSLHRNPVHCPNCGGFAWDNEQLKRDLELADRLSEEAGKRVYLDV